MTDPRPIAVDLFAGVGGMSLGFEQAGFDVVAALELDAAHAGAHTFNFPWCEVVRQDAALTTGDELRQAAARGLRALGRRPEDAASIDVVFGGPPCQGFSVGGLNDPNDPRNGMVVEFARLVRELRPRAFVMENVPAMASTVLPQQDQAVPEWLAAELSDDGYTVSEPRVLNASWFGVPQDRRRLIVIGLRDNEGTPSFPAAKTLARRKTPHSRARPWEEGHPKAPALSLGPAVKDALAGIPDLDRFAELAVADEVALPDRFVRERDNLPSAYAAELDGRVRAPNDYSYSRQTDRHLLTSSLRTTHSAEVIARFAATKPGQSEAVSRFYRLHDDGVSGTLRAGSSPDRGSYSAPRPIHPAADRVISVREAARLSGFPDWFRFTAAKWHGFRQVGNAVCPPFARAVAEAVRESIGVTAVVPEGARALGPAALLHVPSGAGRRPRRHIAAGTTG